MDVKVRARLNGVPLCDCGHTPTPEELAVSCIWLESVGLSTGYFPVKALDLDEGPIT